MATSRHHGACGSDWRARLVSAESPPAFTQNSSFGAEQTRRAITSLLARGSTVGSIVGGLVAAGDMQISAGGGMSVNVAPGEAWVAGSTSSSQGGYYTRVISSMNLPVAASNPTNPRIDAVVAMVVDKAYGGSAPDSFAPAVLTGTATAGATLGNLNGAPALPTSSLLLGYVLVPASASSIVTGDVSNRASQVAQASGLRLVVSGYVDGRSGTFGTLAGTGFTPTRTGAGRYTITFASAFAELPVCLAMSNGVSGLTIAFFTNITAGALGIGIDNTSSTATDDLFTFVALG